MPTGINTDTFLTIMMSKNRLSRKQQLMMQRIENTAFCNSVPNDSLIFKLRYRLTIPQYLETPEYQVGHRA